MSLKKYYEKKKNGGKEKKEEEEQATRGRGRGRSSSSSSPFSPDMTLYAYAKGHDIFVIERVGDLPPDTSETLHSPEQGRGHRPWPSERFPVSRPASPPQKP